MRYLSSMSDAQGAQVDGVPTHHVVAANGTSLHALDWSGPGEPVVLFHATGFHAHVWTPVAHGLRRHHRVVAVDQRGHGDSSKPPTGYAWQTLGEDVFSFLDQLGLSKVVAVGHSGGATAIAYCAAHHPDAVRKAVLIDPILYPRPQSDALSVGAFARRARNRRMVWDSTKSLLESYRGRAPFNTWRPDVLRYYVEGGTCSTSDGQVALKCPGDIEAQIYEAGPQLNSFALLEKVIVPVLLLRGERSPDFSERSAAEAVRLLPQGRVKTIAGTSHFIPMERPDIIEAEIQTFITS